uniref:PDS5 cohesin associated factor B n=1 Tax=Sinocyclocheilus grahami TaxID=75366 RepID=A0A672M2Q4_SINGR
ESMAHSKNRATDGKITYPPGVKEISDKISKEEMVRRLKMVVKTFMDMDQDSEEEKELYLNLALHLASDFFLKHPDKDVRLLVACCLADIFRIYAPEAPYTSPDKLKDIFMFITRQLKGLEDTKSAQFNRYFYLLENIAWVKSYNICFELEDSNEIFTQLYRTLFQVINNGHNQKVHMHMVDLMSSIVCEGDSVSQELLDTVLVNLVPAHKNLNKQAYDLAKALLKRTAQAIEPYITNFFNQVLMLGKTSVSDLSEHVFDLILELYNIDSHLLLSVLPQLEFKLKSNDNDERLQVVKLLAKMFGAKDSELASQNKPLWQCYLGRFNDIHVPVRLECVKFASHCLMNHPDLAKDLTEYLKVRSHDPEEAIRHDVIVSIVTASKKDLSLVNDHLLNFVKERTLDKRWRVRKEAMMGLAQIYKKYALQAEAGKEAAKQISWIKDKLLHIYYQNSIDDRLLVERIFAQYLVPHNLETTERMKCLYYLYATLDGNAVKALNEMWKCQNMLRHNVKDLLDLIKQPKSDSYNKAVFSKVMVITRNLPDPGKTQDFVKKLAQVLEEDEKIRKQLETLVSPSCSCKQAEVCVKEITKKLGSPKQPSNPFLEMVKFLLERIAPVHIDTESISALIKQVNKSIEGTADDEDEGVPTEQAIRAGLELLKVLSFTHPVSFHSAETFESLLGCLKMDDEKVAEAALQIFKNTGNKLEESFPHIKSVLLPVLQHKAKKGSPRQAKYAIHCIHAMFSNRDTHFAQIFEIQGLKLMVRWLLGVKNNQSKSGNSTLRMLTAILSSDGDLTEQGKIGKPDMSRLRLAAGCAILRLSQEPCYHEIITLEQYQLCALVINDECYQVRQAFAQKLHKGLCRLRLPLEYLAVFTLCAKDPVKERRAHARQCLVKNINLRREYLKQHAAVSEKLISLLPEYVVPYAIHLLVHDPDYVKVQDIEQLKDIKEALWFVLEILMAKNENNSHAFIRKMVENIKQTKDGQCPDDPKINEKLYTVCDVAMNIVISKSTTYSLESPKDPVLPARYFTQLDKNEDISMKSPSETEKPSRGRKRGAAANQDDKGQESKPKRGRKKAANTSTDDAEDQWGEDSSMAEASMETEDEQNSPPKRGRRGRPPKSAASKDETPSKGRRGRRKTAPPADEENEEEQEEEEDDEDDAGSENMEVKPKGRRGRKPRLVAAYIYDLNIDDLVLNVLNTHKPFILNKWLFTEGRQIPPAILWNPHLRKGEDDLQSHRQQLGKPGTQTPVAKSFLAFSLDAACSLYMCLGLFHGFYLTHTICFSGGRSRAAANQEEESEEEMNTAQQSEEEEDEPMDSSPKVSFLSPENP